MLIIGATGTSGKLAVAAARQAGAGRIVAAGRRLSVLEALGVDATVDLSLQGEALTQAFAAAAAGRLSGDRRLYLGPGDRSAARDAQ